MDNWDSFLTRLERELAEMLLELAGDAELDRGVLDSGASNSGISDSGPAGSGPAGSGPAGSGPSNSGISDSRVPVGQVWVPPSGLGPLPAQLEVRARALLSATSNARATLALRHFDVGRHLAAVQSVPSAASSRPPLYLDVAG